jgi:hypothetical protein
MEFGKVFKCDGKIPYKLTSPEGMVREGFFTKAGESDLPAVTYKITFSDGTVMEGVLCFRPNLPGRGAKWVVQHALDWHLVKPPVTLRPASK